MKIFLFLIIIILSSETWAACNSGDCVNGFGTYTFDKGKYTGNWKNAKRNGHGTWISNDGHKYVGGWKNNVRDGKSKINYPNGNIFEGEYDYGKMKYGTLTYANGDIYVGNFGDIYYGGSDHSRSGFGTHTFNNGDIYVGEWKNDLMHGLGEYTYYSGAINKGFFAEGKFFGTKSKWDKKVKKEKKIIEKREKKIRKENKKRQKIAKEKKEKYERIYNACLLNKSKKVDMQVSAISNAVYKTCKDIATDPSWYENFKYNR